jgi:histidinol dehydrogenase
MLRIITEQAEAQTELRRIGDRTHDDEIRAKEALVRDILEAVKRQGDRALLDYADKPVQQSLELQQLRLSGSELDAAYQQIPKELLDAIRLSCRKLEEFYRQRVPKSWVQFGEDDVVWGKRYIPVERAGLYVPADKPPCLSTVLMQAIPAKAVNVKQIIMVTPPDTEGKIDPKILVAAQEAGVTEIYRIGGAQAIAALAYGTETIPKVETITGPGDIYVTIAKKMVYGTVGIDFPAGVSDLMIIAEGEANPIQIAADLLAQAEQDTSAAAILLTSDRQLAELVQEQVNQQLQRHPQRIFVEKAIAHYGLIVVVNNLEEAAEFANRFAPQYLALQVSDPWDLSQKIRHAGAIFLGNSTPKVVGHYLGSSSSILPTSRTARYTSTVGVETFVKQASLLEYSPAALKKISSALQILSEAEGLPAATDSIRLRILDFGF